MTTEQRRHVDPDVPSLGTFLASRRLERNLSVEDIADKTGIHLAVIRALEADDHTKLPSPVFVRGFIKLYAKALDIDPAEPLAIYQREAPQEQTALPIGPDILSNESLAESPLVTRKKIGIGLAILLLVAATAGLFHVLPNPPFFGRLKDASAPSSAAGNTPSAPADATAVEPEAAQPSKTTAASAATAIEPPYTLTATFTAPTWMRITIDDGSPQEAFYQAGSRHQWRAETRFDLLIGNGGGISLFLNGNPVTLDAKQGQVVKLSLPPMP